MGIYRVCKAFTVESGHMLSKHQERCRIPHGHTRRIEVVVSAPRLDSREMVVDFKALKLAVQELVEAFDHSMAVNSQDPLKDQLLAQHPDGILVFENQDPTTEVIAKFLFDGIQSVLRSGWRGNSASGIEYSIGDNPIQLERVRVWETPSSWAEYQDQL